MEESRPRQTRTRTRSRGSRRRFRSASRSRGSRFRIGGLDDGPKGTPDEPAWPPDSPFALIVERRLPRTSRMSMANTTAEEMMLIAKDQFSRGIFHMPHPLHHARGGWRSSSSSSSSNNNSSTTRQARRRARCRRCSRAPPPLTAYRAKAAAASAAAPTTTTTMPAPAAPETEPDAPPPGLLPGETFSRAKELFTIATEVLDVAERFPLPSARAALAAFADGLLGQMKLEGGEHGARGDDVRAVGGRRRDCPGAGARESRCRRGEGGGDRGAH